MPHSLSIETLLWRDSDERILATVPSTGTFHARSAFIGRAREFTTVEAEISFAGSEEHWVCPICRQKLDVEIYGCVLYPENVAKCELREHAKGSECIAYLNPRRARELLRFRDAVG